MNDNTYVCAICGGTFETGWTDAEAKAEMLRDFGAVPVEEQRLVCNDCYQRFKPQNEPDIYAEFLEEQSRRNTQN